MLICSKIMLTRGKGMVRVQGLKTLIGIVDVARLVELDRTEAQNARGIQAQMRDKIKENVEGKKPLPKK